MQSDLIRRRCARGILALGVAAALLGAPAAHAATTVTSLKADQTATPLGVDDPQPALSWQLSDAKQTAYRVLVATSPSKLQPGQQDVWDSGKVASGESAGIAYGGPALASSQRYYWAVQVWDGADQASGWSAPSWFETGLLHAADWGAAQWITPDAADRLSWSDFTLDADFTLKSGAASFLFRAKDSSNFYMWQVNSASTPGKVLLRPHTAINGSYANIAEVDLAPVITTANVNQPHHIRIQANGATITTWIDGTQVDSRTDTKITAKGTIGFRASSTNGVTERADYDNVVVRSPDGTTVFSDDASTSPDPNFPQTPVVNGQLEPGDGVTLLSREASAPVLRHDFTLDKPVAQRAGVRLRARLRRAAPQRQQGRRPRARRRRPASTPSAASTTPTTSPTSCARARTPSACGSATATATHFSQYGFRYARGQEGDHAPARHVRRRHDARHHHVARRLEVVDRRDHGQRHLRRRDLRRAPAPAGWDSPGFDDSQLVAARGHRRAPSGRLVASLTPPVRAVAGDQAGRADPAASPASTSSTSARTSPAGSACTSAARPGPRVQMRTAEELGADGMLDTVTNRSAEATDTYTLAGRRRGDLRAALHLPRLPLRRGDRLSRDADARQPRGASSCTPTCSRPAASTPPTRCSTRSGTNNRWAILNNSMSTPTDNPVRDERTPPAMDVQAYDDASTREFGMDRFYAKYLEDLPPGTALPNDDGKSQYPDMAGGQVGARLDALRAVRRPRDAGRQLPADEGVRGHERHRRPEPHLAGDQGFGDWCPPVHGSARQRRHGQPERGRLLQRGVDRQHRAVLQAGRRHGQGGRGARPRRRRGALPRAGRRHQGRVQRTTFLNAAGDALRRRAPDDEHPAARVRDGARREPEGRRRPARADTSSVDNGGHLDTGIFGTRYLVDALGGDRPDRRGDDRARPDDLPGLRLRDRPRARRRRGRSGPTLGDGDARPRDVRRHQRLALHAARRDHAGEPRLRRDRHRAAGAAGPRPRRGEHRHGARHGLVRVDAHGRRR